MIKTITASELKILMEKGEVLLVYVREPAEHRSENISGANLIPLSAISHEMLKSKSIPIVIHCQSGRRSLEACKILEAQDPNLDLYTLEGGITAWKKSGCGVNLSESCALPLDRQMQLTAGFLVLIGVILGIFINPWFNIISGFVGMGLMFAGLSGWCGMIKLLALMPWNK
jgi:rhodanese-related sulfurtransferase